MCLGRARTRSERRREPDHAQGGRSTCQRFSVCTCQPLWRVLVLPF